MRKIDFFKKLRGKEATAISKIENIKELVAEDAMIKPVLLYPDNDATKIIKKLKREDTNVCLVVTKDKRFLGEIRNEDIIKLFLYQVKYEPLVQVINLGYRRDFLYKKAGELMKKHKSVVYIDTPINKVIKLVYKKGFQYIPVLDKDKRVIGVVTPSSLINLLQKY